MDMKDWWDAAFQALERAPLVGLTVDVIRGANFCSMKVYRNEEQIGAVWEEGGHLCSNLSTSDLLLLLP